ncbi:ATP synthase F1 subunit epsilon [Candidatus Dojkabacteria bacterium]|nr:ATP synthase F1 subunit epsilon [Candidatus Dojkabacteria bacterium]
MEIIIATPNGVIYDKKALSITIPTESGVITVLDEHQPMISLLRAGEIIINEESNGADYLLSVSTGVLEVQPESHIYIMADTAERAEDIDIQLAEEAMLKAKKELERLEHIEDVDFARLQAMIDKELARVTVGRKYKGLKRN